ncbi:LuxR family two component transcriptional regulator [Deinococcus yavapaiensis KR-236]|uniref:LuxR family two component transcriptional regulator n=1 Tax=Deinococcus yavapaiensis KR-236 TaxID=694435 RepID=A0A318S3Z7_9DEIO|nr:LuxR family two component transcriptional regulator [Deinococcus yavapaiensis KR-236]
MYAVTHFSPVRVLLVDDHAVVRQGIKMFLGTSDAVEVVGEARNGQEGLDLVEKLAPHVVLMDLLMPVMDGVTAIRELKRRFPDVEVIALTSVLEDKKVVDAVQAGATGYLLKDTDSDALEEAIQAAARGEVRLHPEAAKRLAREVRTPEMREALTPRETEILRLVARGRANKEIARDLAIEERTVKTHVTHVLSKLGLASRTQAAIFAFKEGLVGLD